MSNAARAGLEATHDGGPWFDDLSVGQRFDRAPGLTLTDGVAAVHQALVGDRLALALDHDLARQVAGSGAPLAHPALVWDVTIGQSTLATRRVVANLFYRGLVFRRAPSLGDTLRTVTEVVVLRVNQVKQGRRATGMVALRVTTRDQRERVVLDFHRCAMLPVHGEPGDQGSLDAIETELPAALLDAPVAAWKLKALSAQVDSTAVPGRAVSLDTGDVVSAAPELVRLSLNLASVHSTSAPPAVGGWCTANIRSPSPPPKRPEPCPIWRGSSPGMAVTTSRRSSRATPSAASSPSSGAMSGRLGAPWCTCAAASAPCATEETSTSSTGGRWG